MAPPTDEQLMDRLCSESSAEAFEELLRRYEQPLFGYLVRLTGDTADAHDLFQETFLRIFRNRASFKAGRRFAPWAYRIATNLCVDTFRKTSTAAEDTLEPILLQDLVTSDDPSPEERFFEKDQGAAVQELVQKLPEKYKAVIVLAHYQDCSAADIADVLCVPAGTVKSRLHNALKLLARMASKRGRIHDMH